MTPTNRSLPGNAGGPVWALRALLSRLLARPLVRGQTRNFRGAIVKLDRIGDAVLAVSAIRAILRHHGETECLLIVTPFAAPLLAAEFPATPQLVLPIEVGHKRLLWEGRKARTLLRGIACAEAICLRHQRSDWDELVLSWVGGRRTYVLDEARAQRESAGRRTFLCAAGERTQFVEPIIADSAECRELERHRQLLADVVAAVVRGGLDKKAAGTAVQRASEKLPEADDRRRFAEMAETELTSLHEGNFARYRLRPAEFAAWQKTWR